MGAGASAANDGGAEAGQKAAETTTEATGGAGSGSGGGDGPPKPKVAQGWGGAMSLDRDEASADEGDADGTTMIVGKLPDDEPRGGLREWGRCAV